MEEGCGIHLGNQLSDMGDAGMELPEYSEAQGGVGCDVPGVDCWVGERVAIGTGVLFSIVKTVTVGDLIVYGWVSLDDNGCENSPS